MFNPEINQIGRVINAIATPNSHIPATATRMCEKGRNPARYFCIWPPQVSFAFMISLVEVLSGQGKYSQLMLL